MTSRTIVTLPNFFRSFVKPEPRVNPYYHAVKAVSEGWLAEKCSFSDTMRRKVRVCDFSYFCSIAAPEAPRNKLRTVCDWGNWVFPFDDMFDAGDLRSDPQGSRKVLQSLMADMTGRYYGGIKVPVVKAHDDIFRRLSAEAPHGVQRRFAKAMQFYTTGVAEHVSAFTGTQVPSLDTMLRTRQLSVGVAPLYHLVEYAHSLVLPDEVFENPVIQTLERLGAELVILSNDMLSYRKEEAEDCPFNMIAACRMAGQGPQEAFDTVAALLEQRYDEWDQSMGQLPSWDNKTNDEVCRYIEGIQNVVQANISWSFWSGRYLGSQVVEVRETRKIDVMEDPPYLRAMEVEAAAAA